MSTDDDSDDDDDDDDVDDDNNNNKLGFFRMKQSENECSGLFNDLPEMPFSPM